MQLYWEFYLGVNVFGYKSLALIGCLDISSIFMYTFFNIAKGAISKGTI
jgi:hypothetical protein